MDRLFRRLVLEISAVWFWGSNRDRWVACGSLRAYDPRLCVALACLLVCSACASSWHFISPFPSTDGVKIGLHGHRKTNQGVNVEGFLHDVAGSPLGIFRNTHEGARRLHPVDSSVRRDDSPNARLLATFVSVRNQQCIL